MNFMRCLLFAAFTLFLNSSTAFAEFVITMGGDINMNKSLQVPEAEGVRLGNNVVPFASLTRGIRHLLDGDLNFANIETVVTDRTDLTALDKGFAFRTHPEALRHLAGLGFNLFSLANNHAFDYGFPGMAETDYSMNRLRLEFAQTRFAGLGHTRAEAAAPVIFEVEGRRIAFAAIGITNERYRPSGGNVGVLNFRNDGDYSLVLRSLRNADADFRILSIHYGTEKQVELDAGQRRRYQRAIDEGNVDLVIGHHPHVVRPVEMHHGKVIIYSLGNYLMIGAASLDGRPFGRDYGLFARLYFDTNPTNGVSDVQAMEVVPLTSMHIRPRAMGGSVGVERVRFLNELSQAQIGTSAITFIPRADGSGYACQPEHVLGRPWGARAARVCTGTSPSLETILP